MMQELEKDPYNVRALLLQGQFYYTTAMAYGGKGYKNASQDFKQAAKINKRLADPHFGLGTVYFHMAIFDLVKRERYKVHQKGKLRFNKTTRQLERILPLVELYEV